MNSDKKYNNVVIEQQGIKCDNCDWNDMEIPSSDYPNWVNKPCPKCGANLLTEEDFKRGLLLNSLVDVINSFSPEELESFDIDSEKIKSHPMMQGVEGLEHLNDTSINKLIVSLDTHEGFNIKSIKGE